MPKAALGSFEHDKPQRAHTHQLATQHKKNSCVWNDHLPSHCQCRPPSVASRDRHTKDKTLSDISCGASTTPLVSNVGNCLRWYQTSRKPENARAGCINSAMTHVEQNSLYPILAHHSHNRSCRGLPEVWQQVHDAANQAETLAAQQTCCWISQTEQ